MSTSRKSLFTKLIIVLTFGLSGGHWVASPDTVKSSNVDWTACVIIFLFCPTAVLGLMGLQALNPMSPMTWKRPSWSASPFDGRDLLQFFHLTAFCFMAAGLGGIAMLAFKRTSAAPLVMSLHSIGFGLWLGVRLCIWVFRKRISG